MDGVGEWATTSLATESKLVEVRREIHFPHSLWPVVRGLHLLHRLQVNSGEYKVIGLAPYGKPKYAALIFEHLIDLSRTAAFG